MMAAITTELASTNAFQRLEDGRVLINFVGGFSREFANESDFRTYIRDNVGDPNAQQCQEITLAVLLGHLLSRDPLLDDPVVWNGKKGILDVEQALVNNVFRVI